MILIDTVTPESFYNSGGHFLFYMLIAAHVCIFIDISPLQKYPMCQLNLLLASLISAGVPSIVTLLVAFPTPAVELATGIGVALLLSFLTTLTIQRILNVDVNF